MTTELKNLCTECKAELEGEDLNFPLCLKCRIKAFQEKQNNKLERYEALAEKKGIESARMYERSHDLADMIPFGQPILVGHHSENRHRKHIEKIRTTFQKSIDLKKTSEYYEAKAENIQNPYAIKSDDPEAIQKLKQKLAEIEQEIEQVKEHNKKCKDFVKLEVVPSHRENEECIANTNGNYKRYAIINKVTKEIRWESSRVPQDIKEKIEAYAKTGVLEKTEIKKDQKVFESYHLQNLNGNKTRIKKRIDELQSVHRMQEIDEEVNGIRIFTDKVQNRVQMFFPSIPSEEVRTKLKSNGFKWSPFNKAWQRMTSQYSLDLARDIAKEFKQ